MGKKAQTLSPHIQSSPTHDSHRSPTPPHLTSPHSSPRLLPNNSPLPTSSSTASEPPPTRHRYATILVAVVGRAASRAVHLHLDRCPDFAAGTGARHESCGRAKGGEDRLGVAAGVCVGVEFAHDCGWVWVGFGLGCSEGDVVSMGVL